MDVGFMEIKMRSAGRYDLQLPELSAPHFSFLGKDAPWMPLVKVQPPRVTAPCKPPRVAAAPWMPLVKVAAHHTERPPQLELRNFSPARMRVIHES